MIGDLLSRGFHRNRKLVHAQAAGLTHAQSLAQTEYNVNCFNWVVGHLIVSRSQMLVDVFDAEPVITDAVADRYSRESEPITGDGPGVVPFDELLALLDVSQDSIRTVLVSAGDVYLAEETVVGDSSATRAAQVMFTYFHDTYHTGQTDLLRQMSGLSDKII